MRKTVRFRQILEELLAAVFSQQALGGGAGRRGVACKSAVPEELSGALALVEERPSEGWSGLGRRSQTRRTSAACHRVFCNRSRVAIRLGLVTLFRFGVTRSVLGAYGSLCARNTCKKAEFPVIIVCSPSDWAEEELSGPPKRGFGLMFLSAVVLHALHGFQGSTSIEQSCSVRVNSWGFFLCTQSCEAEPQPLFPGDVETSFRPAPRLTARVRARYGQTKERAGNVREAGVILSLLSKGAGCERERYSKVV